MVRRWRAGVATWVVLVEPVVGWRLAYRLTPGDTVDGPVVLGRIVDRPWTPAIYGILNVHGLRAHLLGTTARFRGVRVVLQLTAIVQLPVGLVALAGVIGANSPLDVAPVDSVGRTRRRDDSSLRSGGPRDDT